MLAQLPTEKEPVSMSANRALYQRFMDLPRSERDKMQAELEAMRLWWHFKSHLAVEGNDLGEAKAKAVAVLSYYLGVSLMELVTNRVAFQTYEVFSANRQTLTDKV